MVVAMADDGIPLDGPRLPPLVASLAGPADYIENGRQYHGWRRGKYMFPCDEAEMDRMDIYHKLFDVARRGILHKAPFTPNYDEGPQILDLGTGTGIWAIDMADKYIAARANVEAMDLSLIQPEKIPPNIKFSRQDIDSPWHGLAQDSYDLIHMRMLNGSIASWQDTYAKIFRHLKPEFGWIEHVEIDMVPRCDDGTLPPNSHVVQWVDYLLEATSRAGRPLAINPQTRAMLELCGYVDIQEEVIMLPLNSWHHDPHHRDVGRWYNLGLTQGLEALSLGPLTRVFHWSKEDVHRLIAEVKREICNKKYHAYCNMHIWTARRPGAPAHA